jgi:hypothetical protein
LLRFPAAIATTDVGSFCKTVALELARVFFSKNSPNTPIILQKRPIDVKIDRHRKVALNPWYWLGRRGRRSVAESEASKRELRLGSGEVSPIEGFEGGLLVQKAVQNYLGGRLCLYLS